MRDSLGAGVFLLLVVGCAAVPDGAYYPGHRDPSTVTISNVLHRAAKAAGDDPTRYSFAKIQSPQALALTSDNATFYFSDGLAKLPISIVEPVVAHEVAHETLGHVGTRRTVSWSLTAGFFAAGFMAPGVGLLDLVVNPLVIRAFNRSQELAADQRAVEILGKMGYPAPRRALAEALTAVQHVNGPELETTALSWQPKLKTRLKALGPLEPLPAVASDPNPTQSR